MILKNREDVLKEVNQALEAEGLEPWDNIKRIGMYEKGETQIVGVSHVIRDLKQFYIIIVFNTIQPDGTLGVYGVRFHRRGTICVVAIINEHVLCTYQHRLCTGRWEMEIPRGWYEPVHADQHPLGAAGSLLERETSVEWVSSFHHARVHKLGSVWEDTGTRGMQVELALLEAQTDIPYPKHTRLGRIHHHSWDTILELVDKSTLNDQASLTALWKVQRYLEARRKAGVC